jgi:sugar diacid utilization regulator
MFYFRDVKEVLLLDNCLKELPATMVCAPEVLALKNYDRKHNTIYYETLYSYLRNNQRPVQTIKELNIHRSTLIYRLEKIQKITGLDTVNFDNQWYLLLSYKLLDHAARYGGT